MNKLRLFLAEDHTVVREGLHLLLDAQPDMTVVGETGDGADILPQVRATRPDVVLMDLSLPGCNGIQATRRLKRAFPRLKVLGLTIHEVEDYLRRMKEAGASGYVLKRSAGSVLTTAIRRVARGGVHFDLPRQTESGTEAKPATNPAPGTVPSLSDREKAVLKLMALGHSQKEIATELDISPKTVETYKMRLMAKLNVRNRAGLVRHAMHFGWLTEL